MNILGISAFVHDSSACLIRDGQIIANVEEERFNREKHTSQFPCESVRYVLDSGRLQAGDIDLIAFNWDPWCSLIQEVRKALLLPLYYKIMKYNQPPKNFATIFATFLLRRHLTHCLEEKIIAPIKWVLHHRAHAASAYYLSPFNDADIVVIDGHGENCSTTCYAARGMTITEQMRLPLLSSLGILYQNFTHYLGFREYQEGVTMALAAYGRNTYKDFFDQKVRLLPNGKFCIHTSCMGWWHYVYADIAKELGPIRANDAPITQREKDLAASLQACVKKAILHVVKHRSFNGGSRNLCLSGGVFLNCDINKAVLDSGSYERVFIPPFTSDSGGAIGAALHCVKENTNQVKKTQSFFSPYLGPEYSHSEIETALRKAEIPFKKSTNICRDAASALASGKIIGWFQGQLESGPRALGNRSILAAPFDLTIRDRINNSIKKRESFRPFGPILTASAAEKYFDISQPFPPPAYYMLLTVDVKEAYREQLAAITHVDGSSRIQVVTPDSNRLMHKLLLEFEAITGFAILLNTSFNVKEPIVCSPFDAVRTFSLNDLDVLFMGDFFSN